MARNFTSSTDKLEATIPLGYRPSSAGTIFFAGRPSWSSGDGVTHVFSMIASGATFFLDFEKFSDNNVYVGWYQGGVDQRLVVADTGLFTANQDARYAFTWDISGGASARQELWKNGVSVGVRIGAFSTAGFATLCIGNYTSFFTQNSSAMARLARWGMWLQALTGPELLDLNAGARLRDIRPRDLLLAYQLDGLSSPEPDFGGGAANLTVTGATAANNPSGEMFTRYIPSPAPAAAAATPNRLVPRAWFAPEMVPLGWL